MRPSFRCCFARLRSAVDRTFMRTSRWRSRSRSQRAIDWNTPSGVAPPMVRLTAVMPEARALRTISGVSASTFTGVLNGPGLARKSTTIACSYRGQAVGWLTGSATDSRSLEAIEGATTSPAASFEKERRERTSGVDIEAVVEEFLCPQHQHQHQHTALSPSTRFQH